MSFVNAYLTPTQMAIWRLRFDGNSQAEISRRTGVTRQTINKAFGAIDSKVTKALLEAAKVNRLEIRRVDMERGFLLGRSSAFGLDAMVTFSDENGVQIWYRGEGDCSTCEESASCREALLKEARLRGIKAPPNFRNLDPSRIADLLYERLTEDMD